MNKVYVPPLKIQGIKTKIVPYIKEMITIDSNTTWIEPFMGSGVVGFNVAPKNAIFSDLNPHIINFYNDLKNHKITSLMVRDYLEIEGNKLAHEDSDYYYKVRDRFNKNNNSLDFLFLNRSCFNGLMRFNKKGDFNVPYCHKPLRFSKAYITKIVNQVSHVEKLLLENNWTFINKSFNDVLSDIGEDSFIYCDPPYIGRNTDYFDTWDETKELLLNKILMNTRSKFLLSTWDYNKYRKNEYLNTIWKDCNKRDINHFYHVGALENNRGFMMEALLYNYTI